MSRLSFAAGRLLMDSAPGGAILRRFRGAPERPRSLLILRLDGIGDYVLFRNFLAALRGSSRYRDHRITLCGNALWRDLALGLDAAVVDGFEWIDTAAFRTSARVRFDALGRLLALGAGTVLQPRHSREAAVEDAILRHVATADTIGSAGDTHNIDPARKARGDRRFSRLIRPDPAAVFEFDANRSLFEQLLGEDLSHVVPRIERERLGPRRDTDGPYAVLFPGAGEARRRWSPERFGTVAEHLVRSGLRVLVCGGPSDRPIADDLLRGRSGAGIVDLTGRSPLHDLAALIADARVLVSNESGAVHIAAATGTPTVCVSNGNHYGRFTEYPPRLATCVTTLYPPVVEEARQDAGALIERYRRGSFEAIDAVSVERVLDALRTMI